MLAYIDALGGPVVAVLLLLSVAASSIILFRILGMWLQRPRGIQADALLTEAVSGLAHTEISAGQRVPLTTTESSAPRIRSILSTWNVLQQGLDPEQTRSEVYRLVRNQIQQMASGLRALEVIATVAPLLGLFGTVLGMIDAFRQLQTAGNAVDPSILAGGIWVALLTTAAGLAVAMPVSLVLTWLETRIESERVAVETLTADVLGTRPSIEPHNPSAPRAGEAALAG